MKAFLSLVLVVIASVFLAGCNPFDYNAKSGLQVITNDTASSVFIDGQYVNKTPLIEKNMKPGTYKLMIQPEDPNLVPYETDVTLRKGLLTVVTWKPATRPELSSGVVLEMEPLKDKNKTEVSFVTVPDGAIITLGDKKEFSPIVIPDIAAGTQEFEVTLPSYETQHHSINVQPGYKMLVTVKLGKLQAIEGDVANSEATAASDSATPPSASLDSQQAAAVASGSGTIRIQPTNFFQDGKQVLRVRATPDSNGKELGFAPVNATYPYLGEQKNSWYKIDFNGNIGWVNGAFIKQE